MACCHQFLQLYRDKESKNKEKFSTLSIFDGSPIFNIKICIDINNVLFFSEVI